MYPNVSQTTKLVIVVMCSRRMMRCRCSNTSSKSFLHFHHFLHKRLSYSHGSRATCSATNDAVMFPFSVAFSSIIASFIIADKFSFPSAIEHLQDIGGEGNFCFLHGLFSCRSFNLKLLQLAFLGYTRILFRSMIRPAVIKTRHD